MEDPVWRTNWKAGAGSQWMAFGSAIVQCSWCFLICFVYPIMAFTCCKNKQFGQGFNVRMYVPVLFIAMIAGAGGINGCIALWLNKDFEAGSNELQNNFKTFLIITIIVNSFATIPFFLVCKFIVEKCILKKESSVKPHWFGGYMGNFCWIVFGFIAVAEGWEYAGF